MKMEMEVKPYDLNDFYNEVATKLGCTDTSKANYNCTKLNISSEIQQGFYDYYKSINPNLSEKEITMGVTLILLDKGPKVDKALKPNEIEVFDGFIFQKKGDE